MFKEKLVKPISVAGLALMLAFVASKAHEEIYPVIGQTVSYPSSVTRVIDGDTIEILMEGNWTKKKIRLACVDAPESDQPEGPLSTQYLTELIKTGNNQIYFDNKGYDRYDRMIAEIYIKTEDQMININKDLIQEGYAVVYSQYLDQCNQPADYLQLEEEAKREGKGVWSSPTFIEPSKWRRRA